MKKPTNTSKDKTTDYTASKTVVKGAGFVFLGLIIGRLFGYFTRLIIARYLGPSEYGVLILALSVFGILSVIASLGFQGGLLRFIPEFQEKKQQGKIRPAVYYALKIVLPISLIISLILIIMSDYISIFIFHNPELTLILQIISISIPFTAITSIFLGTVMGLKYVKYRLYIDDIVKPGSRLILVFSAFILGFGLFGSIIAYTLSFLIAMLAGFYFFLKITSGHQSLSLSEKRGLFSYSWPLMLSSIIFIVMGQIDSLMIGFFKTSSDVGIYNAALPTVDILVVVPNALMALFLPVISSLHARNKIGQINELYKRVVKWVLMISSPLFFTFILFPNQILNILFGIDYSSGGLPLSILAIGYFISVVLYPSYDIINLFKKTKFHLYNSIFAVSLNIILDYFLIQTNGIVGAAIATSITYSILGFTATLVAYKFFKLNPYRKSIIRVIGAGIITALIFYTVKSFINFNLVMFISILPIFLIVYCGLLLVFRVFDMEDLAISEAIEKKLGFRIGLTKIIRRFLSKI